MSDDVDICTKAKLLELLKILTPVMYVSVTGKDTGFTDILYINQL